MTAAPIEWTLVLVSALATSITGYAYVEVKRDLLGVTGNWPLSIPDRQRLQPVAAMAVTHERFRLLKQIISLAGSLVCLYLPPPPGALQPQGQVLRVVLLAISLVMLVTTLHSLVVRHRYYAKFTKK